MKPILVTERELAAVYAVHRNTVSGWIKAGLPVKRRQGRAHGIDLVVALRWVRARDQETAEERLAAVRATPDADAARVRKITAEARLAEVNVAEREGQVVPADQLSERWGRMTTAMREAVLAVAPTAVQLGIVSPEQEQALAQLHHDALRHLAERGKP